MVDKTFQGKFIMSFVLICLTGMALALGLFNYFVLSEIEGIRWRMVFYSGTLADIVSPHLGYLGVFAVLFTAAATAAVSWVITWKVAGPVYRLKKDIDSIGAGNLNLKVMLRKNDEFKDTAAELDRMAASLREKFGRIKSDFSDASKIVDTLGDTREDLLGPKSEQLLQKIGDLANNLKR
ncbi:MAG: methyl-accepting chemotaxis protein [Thermodesulfovibrionales bacterium]|nr:methyl-accepting chemotaxis protein [Thermodesulfovibrionales bacterium]